MKVLALGFTKMAYMPYMHSYIELLKRLNCEVHLLYWKRDAIPDAESPEGVKTYVFEKAQEDSVPLALKLINFYQYRRFAMKCLKLGGFDFIIVLHSTPGILLSDYLFKHYKERYILDYRDFTYENHLLYRKRIHKLVKLSAATFVSSKGYLKYLPKLNKLFLSHNFLMSSLAWREVRRCDTRNHSPVRIRFWGLLRHEEINKKIMDRLGNDPRFVLHYHGREQKYGDALKVYSKAHGYDNVFFHGDYQPEDRYTFAQETELLLNMYEKDLKTRAAMGNKYYDGLIFYIPQICHMGTFMGEEVQRKGVGIALDPASSDFADQIMAYYQSVNWSTFELYCDKQLKEIMKDYHLGIKVISEIINSKKDG